MKSSVFTYLLAATVVATVVTACSSPGGTIAQAAAGVPTPGTLVVNHLDISQDMPSPGDNITVSVDVANNATQPGTFPVQLCVNGKVVNTLNVSLAAGVDRLVNFSMRAGAVGTYLVSVGKCSLPILVGPVYSELTP